MLVETGTYVNIHAHRTAADADEWVIMSLDLAHFDRASLLEKAFYSIGLHPWNAPGSDFNEKMKILRDIITDSRILAIGECGLDKNVDPSMEEQMAQFWKQVELAVEFKLPVIIHAVKSNQELIRLQKESEVEVPMIIHGFTGSFQLAMDLIRAGYYLSFGAQLLRSPKNLEAATKVPLESLFIETDESRISVAELYRLIAEKREISESYLKDHMQEKANRIFKREYP